MPYPHRFLQAVTVEYGWAAKYRLDAQSVRSYGALVKDCYSDHKYQVLDSAANYNLANTPHGISAALMPVQCAT